MAGSGLAPEDVPLGVPGQPADGGTSPKASGEVPRRSQEASAARSWRASRVADRGALRRLPAELAAKALDLALYVWLARTLGLEEFGFFFLVQSLAFLLVLAAGWIGRESAVATTCLGLATLALFHAPSLGDEGPVLVALLAAARLVQLLAEHQARSKDAERSTITWLGLRVMPGVVALGVAGAALTLGAGARSAPAAVLAGALTQLLLASLSPVRRESMQARVAEPGRGTWLAPAWHADALALQAYHGSAAVGLFGGLVRIVDVFTPFCRASHALLLPVFLRDRDDPRETLAVLCRQSLRVHLLVSIGLAVLLACQAPVLLPLVLGSDYVQAIPGFGMLVWALPATLMSGTLLQVLHAQGRSTTATAALILGAVIQGALLFAFVPDHSFLGAAVAVVAGEFAVFLSLLFLLGADLEVVDVASVAWRPLVAGAAVASALTAAAPLVPGGWAGLGLAGGVGALTYAAALTGLGAMEPRKVEGLARLLDREAWVRRLRIYRSAEAAFGASSNAEEHGPGRELMRQKSTGSGGCLG